MQSSISWNLIFLSSSRISLLHALAVSCCLLRKAFEKLLSPSISSLCVFLSCAFLVTIQCDKKIFQVRSQDSCDTLRLPIAVQPCLTLSQTSGEQQDTFPTNNCRQLEHDGSLQVQRTEECKFYSSGFFFGLASQTAVANLCHKTPSVTPQRSSFLNVHSPFGLMLFYGSHATQ